MSARERNRDECDPGIAAGHQITFSFEGRSLCATEGQTVAAALIANGISVFVAARSTTTTRLPLRSWLLLVLLDAGGWSSRVRTCMTAVTPGMEVEREHCWRTADHDVLRASEFLSPLMPPASTIAGSVVRLGCGVPSRDASRESPDKGRCRAQKLLREWAKRAADAGMTSMSWSSVAE